MIASHSDADHYGGLHDLVDKDAAAREELDCTEVAVAAFGHPGLSRFPSSVHSDKLGPRDGGQDPAVFTRLMDDRDDARTLVNGTGADGLRISGWWRSFIRAVLDNDDDTAFTRITIDRTDAGNGDLPEMMAGDDFSVKVLGPVTLERNGAPALPDLGDTGKNTNGHSVCLRIDYRNARILMTGDLNTRSMNWLAAGFDGHMDEWNCDVAKACHHGSHDVSFKFLKAIKAAATVISSGDNEGHAHPRPEIVAASALSGHEQLSADGDKVITPLIYMTEIERSVLLGEVNRIEIENAGASGNDLTVLGKPIDEFSGREFLAEADWEALDDLDDNATSAGKGGHHRCGDRSRGGQTVRHRRSRTACPHQGDAFRPPSHRRRRCRLPAKGAAPGTRDGKQHLRAGERAHRRRHDHVCLQARQRRALDHPHVHGTILGLLGDDAFRRGFDFKSGSHKRLGVVAARRLEHVPRRPLLHYLAGAHDDDVVGKRPDHFQVMRDEQIGKLVALLQVAQQIDDLRLHAHVERTGRLVQHDEFGTQHHGPGNGDALALAAGKLMRIAVHGRRIDAHLVERLGDTATALVIVELIVVKHFRPSPTISATGHARRQRAVGILEDDLHFLRVAGAWP